MNRALILGVFSLGLPMAANAAAPNVASQALLDLCMNRTQAMSLDQAKALIVQGADLGAQDSGGAYPFLLAVETYAYVSGQHDAVKTKAALDVARYLVQQGSDVSSTDGRSMSPAIYLFGWAAPADVDAMFDLIVSAKPNFGVRGLEGATVMNVLVSHQIPKQLDFILAHTQELGVDLTAIDNSGASIVLSASAHMATDSGGKLVIQRLLETLPEQDRLRLVDLPDHSGVSPLMLAIVDGKVSVAEYLLANYRLDVNRVSLSEETPLSLARALGNQELIAKLIAAGAKDLPPFDSSELFCDRPNEGPMTFDRLNHLIFGQCKGRVHSVDDLLPLLPPSYASYHSLMYGTLGLARETTSPRFPRAMLYGRDGKLVMTFGEHGVGHPSCSGNQDDRTLEFYSFDDRSAQFSFYKVTFPQKVLGIPIGRTVISGPNPAECLSCHGSPARPVWNSWSLWPGAYGGEMEAHYPGAGENADYQDFIATSKADPESRYRFLPPTSAIPVRTDLGSYVSSVGSPSGPQRNLPFDYLTAELMGQRVMTELATRTSLKPYRYAILGALSCKDPIDAFLPAQTQAALPRRLDDIRAEDREIAMAEMAFRFTTQIGFRSTLVGRYNVEAQKWPNYAPEAEAAGYTADLERIARLRYLIEGVSGPQSMARWFTTFNDNLPSYVTVDITNWEAHAWEKLLDPTQDADLIALYSAARPRLAVGQVPIWIYRSGLSDVQSQLCPKLIAHSMSALGGS